MADLEAVTKQLNAHLIQYFKDKAEIDAKLRALESANNACMQAIADLSKISNTQAFLIKDTLKQIETKPEPWWNKLFK